MSKKILIIDDDKEILFAMSAICEYQEWIPIIALDVMEGIKEFKAVKPDIILIDYHLPVINGIDGVRQLRLIDADIPIIVLTIEEDQKVADKFIKAGASDFALKPIKAPDIISRIKVHLRLMESIEAINKNISDHTKGISYETFEKVMDYMKSNNEYKTINNIAENIGLAYQTTHRYLRYMINEDKVEVLHKYGKIGRPQNKYRLKK